MSGRPPPSWPPGPSGFARRCVAAGARLVEAEAQPDDAVLAVHEPALLAYLEGAWAAWEAAGLTEDPGQDRVVPYVFPHPGLLAGHPLTHPGRDQRPGGALHLRHDDPDRAGHLGGGAGRASTRP